MRESLMYGSVRGARGNSRPYRDVFAAVHESGCGTNAKYQHKPAMSDNWGEADVMRVRSHPLLLTDAVASTITAL